MKEKPERVSKLRQLRKTYRDMVGKIDYSNVFIELEDEIRILEQCLKTKATWKDVFGFDERSLNDDDSYM